MAVTVAYLLNQYPMPSQTFVRRELAALEDLGCDVQRFVLRPSSGPLVDPADVAEEERVRTVLGRGAPWRLLAGVVTVALGSPMVFLSALFRSVRLGIGGQRGVPVNLVRLAEACVLLRWCRAEGIQHLHSHFGTNAPMVALLVRHLGGPTFSFTVHGPEEFDRPEALKLREKMADAAFVVAISDFGRSQLLRWCRPCDRERVHVVRCGLDRSALQVAPCPTPDAARLVSVGRLAEQKGQMVLLEAVARVATDRDDLRVVIVGEGPLRAELEEQIRSHDLQEVVQLTGWMSNEAVRGELSGSRAMILPSFAEGLPVVLMEAMSLGRAVVSTGVAGIPELVDSSCGWLVAPGSVDALEGAIRELLDTPTAELDAMGKRGRARVEQSHDALTNTRLLLELFDRLGG